MGPENTTIRSPDYKPHSSQSSPFVHKMKECGEGGKKKKKKKKSRTRKKSKSVLNSLLLSGFSFDCVCIPGPGTGPEPTLTGAEVNQLRTCSNKHCFVKEPAKCA